MAFAQIAVFSVERGKVFSAGLQTSLCDPLVYIWQISAVIAKTVLSRLLIA